MSYGAVIVKYDSLYHAKIHANGTIRYFGYTNFGMDYEALRREVNTKVHVKLPKVTELRFWDMMGDEICVVDNTGDKQKMISRKEYFSGWKPKC